MPTTAPDLNPRRRALAVVSSRYRHDDLADLASPARDAEALRRVLGAPDLGGFAVETLLNPDVRTAANRVYDFFASAEPDEFLFAYFSCHGLRDASGRLYLATIDTEPGRLPPTAIEAEKVGEWMDASPARQIVLVLDCCRAGAFAADPRQRGNHDRVVLLSASATELAHEDDGRLASAQPSAFAGAFFEGIESGRADSDDNGLITVREAFDYAVARLREDKVAQSPQMRAGVAGDLALARAPERPGRLPADLAALVRNGIPGARQLAVEQLARWLSSSDGDRVLAAEQALAALRSDPNERVARGASQALARRYSEGAADPAPAPPTAAPDREPDWFRRAVYYELRVRTFADSNGDGAGDLAGLRDKLPYLRWLGVDCLLLAPIFESPLRDDGYDIADFTAVHPDLGELADLVELVDAAHQHGIRVVLDLVLNHTSDQHPWFQASRRDPDGPFGDFYVWQDTDELYADATPAAEPQRNWTYDRQRRQYYWHRFSSFEPDLNFDSPRVQQAVLDVMRFWLDRGVDGFRLLTAPYLYERDGTPCEGLDETHDYLRRLRAEVDHGYRGRVLLAWADRWPADAAEYFGDGEASPECSVVAYTSLMPRIFLGMRREDHAPVSAVLAQTKAIPAGCQWGVFLRNGDEMSLDLVEQDERDYLLREYAPLERMRTDWGIRRRLAPLLDGDRGQIELCMALLLSLPGAPVLYYGDEIGMGDNLSLPGSAAIRTPMQWSADRGAGFSTAEHEQLTLPVLLDSVYGYQATNVESQLRNPTSLLQNTRRLLEIRKHSEALTLGTFHEITSDNPAVLGYIRAEANDVMLCVANFSRYPQATRLDLNGWVGHQPVEITGGSRFPVIDTDRYPLSLAGHGFFWLRLVEHRD